MTSATVQLIVISKRMLKKSEAANHCGRSVNRFSIECPVPPIKFGNGDLRWDVQDLHQWINTLKACAGDHETDAIIARL